MNRCRFFGLLAAVLSSGLVFAQQTKFTVTKEVLVKRHWQTSHPILTLSTCELSFRSDGTYKLRCHYQSDDVFDEGKYRVDSGRVYLERTRCGMQGMPCVPENSCEKAVCAVEKTPESATSTRVFRCRCSNSELTFTFGLPGSSVPAGQKKVIEGTAVITVHSMGQTTDNVKIRSRPSVDAKALQCQPLLETVEDPTPIPFVPTGTGLQIVARTQVRERIGEWNNYWYFVHVQGDDKFFIYPLSGWMYGEFIQMKKP